MIFLDSSSIKFAVLSETELDECEFYNADLNSDGVLNILDVIEVINIVLDN